MTTEQIVCSSCKKRITNAEGVAIFLCPKCNKTEIVRCKHCRNIAARYECSSCGFSGPN